MDTDLMNYVVEELNRRKGDWPVIARDTAIPYHTISKWARGVTLNPRVLDVQKMVRHLRALAPAA